MKSIFLLAAALVFLTIDANAQKVQDTDATNANATNANATNALKVHDGGGYQALVDAARLLAPDDERAPVILPPAQNLARQRLLVERNAPALLKARAALQQPIEAPVPANFAEVGNEGYSELRALARALVQESEVRLADGDAAGALDSRLTALQLGRAIAHDAPYVGALVGLSIEGLARARIGLVAAQLNAPQIRAALARLDSMDAQNTDLAATLEIEKTTTQQFFALSYAGAKPQEIAQAKAMLATPEGRQKAGVSDEQARQALEWINLDVEQTKAKIGEAFDVLIERARLPYQQALSTQIAPTPQTIPDIFTANFRNPRTRFDFERNRFNNDWLRAALELRAIQLESGQYPATYDAGTDPFAFPVAPYIYRREGDKYLLYSVGPDGKDENGAEIETLQTNPQTGVQSVTGILSADSTGDIVAPVF